MQKNPARQWLIILIFISAALRLITIGRDSLWFDESISYLASTLPLSAILNNTIQSSHPPLYYLLLAFWRQLIPNHDGYLRLFSMIWNLLLIPLTYWVTLTLLPQKRDMALISALLIVVSPFHIIYSQELRMYTQLMTLTVGGTLAYLQAQKTDKWLWWVAFFMAFLLAIYTHLFSLFALAGIGLYAVAFSSSCKGHNSLKQTTIIIGVLLILLSPWAYILIQESQQSLGSLRPLAQASSDNFRYIKPIATLTFLMFGSVSGIIYNGLALFFTMAISIILSIELVKTCKTAENPFIALLILIVLCTLVVPIVIYLIRPFYLPDRTMAGASPFLLILCAWGTTRKHTPLPYLVYGMIIVMMAGVVLHARQPAIKPPYRDAMLFISQHQKPTDIILHTSDGSYFPALRYSSFFNHAKAKPLALHALLAHDPDPRKPKTVYESVGGTVWELDDVHGKGKRLWLVIALEHSIEWQLAQNDSFNEHYPLLDEYEFGGIIIKVYDLSHPILPRPFLSKPF